MKHEPTILSGQKWLVLDVYSRSVLASLYQCSPNDGCDKFRAAG